MMIKKMEITPQKKTQHNVEEGGLQRSALGSNLDFNLEAIGKDAEKTSSRTRATTFPRPHAPRSQDDETRHEFNDAEDDDDRVGT